MITENRKHTSSISALIHSLINNKIQGAVPLMKCICSSTSKDCKPLGCCPRKEHRRRRIHHLCITIVSYLSAAALYCRRSVSHMSVRTWIRIERTPGTCLKPRPGSLLAAYSLVDPSYGHASFPSRAFAPLLAKVYPANDSYQLQNSIQA